MRIMKRIGWFFGLLLFSTITVFAQGKPLPSKYWIFFKDKGANKQSDPARFLSPKSVERRTRQNIPLDQKDLPVAAEYCQALKEAGVVVKHRSRWLNAVSAWIEPGQVDQIKQLPFVRSVEPMHQYKVDLGVTDTRKTDSYAPGYAINQIALFGLDFLHEKGYNGKGVLIAIMDSGFDRIDQNPGMAHLFERNAIIATKDFVDNDDVVFNEHSHGAFVFSILAGFIDGEYVGSAPGADYLLLRTEDVASETNAEEDNWLAAAEYADSMGADIFSTSLGYSEMDSGSVSYSPSDMDGKTAIITRAAQIAASRGILVVNSAGNSGHLPWRIITAPADGDSVLATGAVNDNGELVNFSSRGPTADGRIKPDLCAVGDGTFYLTQDGSINAGSGTSFSAPLMSGMAAALWQSQPNLTNMELMEIMKRSADKYNNPDNDFGYGVPDGRLAFELIHGQSAFDQLYLNENGVGVYPNPVTNEINVIVDYQNGTEGYVLEMYDDRGGIAVKELNVGEIRSGVNEFSFQLGSDLPFPVQSTFYLRLFNVDRSEVLFDRKMLYFK